MPPQERAHRGEAGVDAWSVARAILRLGQDVADFATFAALSPAQKRAIAEAVAVELGDAFRAGKELVVEAALATPVYEASSVATAGGHASVDAELRDALVEPDAAKAGKTACTRLLAMGLPSDDAGLVPLREELSPALEAALEAIV